MIEIWQIYLKFCLTSLVGARKDIGRKHLFQIVKLCGNIVLETLLQKSGRSGKLGRRPAIKAERRERFYLTDSCNNCGLDFAFLFEAY